MDRGCRPHGGSWPCSPAGASEPLTKPRHGDSRHHVQGPSSRVPTSPEPADAVARRALGGPPAAGARGRRPVLWKRGRSLSPGRPAGPGPLPSAPVTGLPAESHRSWSRAGPAGWSLPGAVPGGGSRLCRQGCWGSPFPPVTRAGRAQDSLGCRRGPRARRPVPSELKGSNRDTHREEHVPASVPASAPRFARGLPLTHAKHPRPTRDSLLLFQRRRRRRRGSSSSGSI